MRKTKRTRVLGCGHFFHNSCLTKWEAKNKDKNTCPCCRYEYYKNRYNIKIIVEDREENSNSSVTVGYTRPLDDFIHFVTDNLEDVDSLELAVAARGDVDLVLGRLGTNANALVADTEC